VFAESESPLQNLVVQPLHLVALVPVDVLQFWICLGVLGDVVHGKRVASRHYVSVHYKALKQVHLELVHFELLH